MRLARARVLLISLILLASFIPSAYGLTAFTDGFEAGGAAWDDLWDQNGATLWTQGQAGEGEAPHSPHGGSNDAWCDLNGVLLTSDNINLLGATSASLTFWYYLDDTEASDLILLLYDGTVYDTIASIGGGTESTWLQYTIPSLDPQYFISNFRVQFNGGGCASGENVFVDDVLVSYTMTSEYNRAASQSLTWSSSAAKSLEFIRAAAQGLAWVGSATRILEFTRAATQSLTGVYGTSRVLEYVRGATQGITYSTIASRIVNYVRTASQTINYNGSITQGMVLLRGASQSIVWVGASQKMFETIRSASQNIVSGFDAWGGTAGVYNALAELTLYIKAVDDPAPGGGSFLSLLNMVAALFVVLVIALTRRR